MPGILNLTYLLPFVNKGLDMVACSDRINIVKQLKQYMLKITDIHTLELNSMKNKGNASEK